MSDLMTLEDTHSAISSAALLDGPLPCKWPDGIQLDLFGLDHAPANHSAQRADAKAHQTKGTCGLSGTSLSKPASLQSYLANRLRQQLDTDGSILFQMTWRDKVTKSGLPYCQLVASVRTTSENDSGSWPTPTAQDTGHVSKGFSLTTWAAAKLAAWGAPIASEVRGTVEDYQRRMKRTTPSQINYQAKMASGQSQNGSGAVMESTGQLNPEHCRWLMGYPKEWSRFADMATP